ncbi:MAG: hypothetical protein JWR81_3654, partial [Pseudonocardia sp.]|nr:hypothetical protein [Pseudonocardia sp.]
MVEISTWKEPDGQPAGGGGARDVSRRRVLAGSALLAVGSVVAGGAPAAVA